MITTENALAASPLSEAGPGEPPSSGSGPLSVTPAKIQAHHRERLAVVYVRQSSPQQVLQHRESTALQYNLQRLAVDWGWPRERVLVIDQDQGRSGSSAEGRLGFQQLLAEVSLDHVGLVLGIEMSRLARSCKDWHQLLELCALFGALLADQDGLYDPCDYNDRLLLGLKGTLSEAELHILRQRMNQGRLNKAKRGELFNHAPIGYVRAPSGELIMDADEQVQSVVRLVFEKFDELGSINAVLQYLARHEIRVGVRPHKGSTRGRLEWRRPNRQTIANLLRHPIYAGAYAWGRRPTDPRRKVPGRPGTGRTVAPIEQWAVLLPDRCPAYITWERYLANRQRMAANRARSDTWGAPREGPSLLAGLVVCGQCGARMLVAYRGRTKGLRYLCHRAHLDHGGAVCQSLAGGVLEACVTRQLLRTLEPAGLELSLRAAADLERERSRLTQHWDRRLERARYEVQRAERQYQAVEPENRLVARELERRWEQTLLEERQIQEARDRFLREQPEGLVAKNREAIKALASDIPALWDSPTTTAADRQRIIRHVIEQVVVTAPQDTELVDVTIRWAGGFTSHHELVRPVARYDQLHDYPRLMGRILELRDAGWTSGRIAKQLNGEGWRPAKRRLTFNKDIVRQLLSRHGRTGKHTIARSGHSLADGEWWFIDLARELAMPQTTLYSWVRRGWVHGRQMPGSRGRWVLWADADELDRLRRLRVCHRIWGNQPQAAELTKPKPRAVT
jgi:DNA invertase Pin-like site-specific DNA recombinase